MTNDFDTLLGNMLLVKEELGDKTAKLSFHVDNNLDEHAPTIQLISKIANGKIERTVEISNVG